MKAIQFLNLNNLLSTQESRIELSNATNIPIHKLNKWLDQNDIEIPKADSLIKIAEYFGCTVDYLLDLNINKE